MTGHALSAFEQCELQERVAKLEEVLARLVNTTSEFYHGYLPVDIGIVVTEAKEVLHG